MMEKSDKKFYFHLSLIAFAALILRLAGVWELSETPSFSHPALSTDLRTYMDFSKSILNGEFTGPFYYQPFYYAAFLPFCMIILGKSVTAVVIMQSIIGALTVFFAGVAGKIVYSKGAGLIGAAFTAISSVLIFYTAYHQIATLQTFNVTLMTVFLLKALNLEEKNLRYYAAAGIMCGIGIATRGNIYILLLPIIALIIWKYGKNWKKTIAASAIFCVALVAVQLPFVIYNTIQCGQLTGASTASGAVLALGNTPEAPPGGRDRYSGAGPMEYPESYHYFMMQEKEKSISVPRQILQYLFNEPAAYLELTMRKMLLFWEYGEIPNNVSIYHEGRASKIVAWNIIGSSSIILTLSLCAIFLMTVNAFKRKDLPLLMLFGVIIFYWLSIAMFYNLSRFRAPILPLCGTAGAIFLTYAAANFKKTEKTGEIILSLALAFFTVFGANNFYRSMLESSVMKLVRPEGTKIINTKNQTVRFDHGPMSFGAWGIIPVKPGDVLYKKFAGLPPVYPGEVTLVFWGKILDGQLRLKVNGENSAINLAKTFNVTLPVTLIDGELKIEIVSFTGTIDGLGVFADFQRDYQRSKLNGEPFGGEYNFRLYGAN